MSRVKISVLVVDDELLIRKSLGKVLRASGYAVELASTGAEGLEKAADVRPHVMILDMRLPGHRRPLGAAGGYASSTRCSRSSSSPHSATCSRRSMP